MDSIPAFLPGPISTVHSHYSPCTLMYCTNSGISKPAAAIDSSTFVRWRLWDHNSRFRRSQNLQNAAVGLPTIVARNTIMVAKNESAILPLVGRNVQTHDAASDASNFEGADFLILTVDSGRIPEQLVSSVYGRVKIPIFVMIDSFGYGTSYTKASDLLRSGASGVVVSVDDH